MNKQKKSSKQREGLYCPLTEKSRGNLIQRVTSPSQLHLHFSAILLVLSCSMSRFILGPLQKLAIKLVPAILYLTTSYDTIQKERKGLFKQHLRNREEAFPSQEHTLALCVGVWAETEVWMWRLNKIKLVKLSWSTE